MVRSPEPSSSVAAAPAVVRGQFRWAPLGVVGGLLVFPAMAAYRHLGADVALGVMIWAAVVSVLSFVAYAFDKRRAQAGGGRVPEKWLHLGALLGGWPGAFLAQRWLRHKSAKFSFQAVFWLVVAAYELGAIDSLLGWPLRRQAGEVVRLLWRG